MLQSSIFFLFGKNTCIGTKLVSVGSAIMKSRMKIISEKALARLLLLALL